MATVPVLANRTVLPDEGTPQVYQSRAPGQSLSISADDFGYQGFQGLRELGRGVSVAGAFWGQVAADDAANQYQEFVNTTMFGDPKAKGPNGEPDIGYMGLKGDKALQAREAIVERLEQFRGKLQEGLSPAGRHQFDQISRRLKNITDAEISRHATTQGNAFAARTNQATAANAMQFIAQNAQDEDAFLQGTARLVSARVKEAQLLGGGPEIEQAAIERAKQEAVEARLSAIGATEPARALRMAEANKKILGTRFDEVYARFRARADQQIGRQTADQVLSRRPLENGEDTKAVIRHFEGFREDTYWDVNHHRTGYGSDTITKPDGTVVEVKEGMKVTREDAERDLERRATESQAQARAAVGLEAWDKLDGRAKASLTSIAYNYGKFPDRLVEAARSGDKEKLAQAIEALGTDNGGVNRERRRREAANVRGGTGVPGNQVEAIEEVLNDPAIKDHPEAQAAAVARINQSYAGRRTEQTRARVAFETRVNDATKEAETTGQTTRPIAREEFDRQYGPELGEARYNEYQAKVQFGVDYKGMQTMSDVEHQQLIDTRIAGLEPGSPGYAAKAAAVERLRLGAEKLQRQRREDPAGSVAQQTAVMEAQKLVNPQQSESFALLARARLAAQESLGIDPETRSPITKAEALKLTEPLKHMIPGTEQQTMREVGQRFVALLGPEEAERAMAYALKARKVDTQVAQQAALVTKSIVDGIRVAEERARYFDQITEMSASDRAVYDLGPNATPRQPGLIQAYPGTMSRPRVIDNPTPPASVEGSPVIGQRHVPPAAIAELLRNPGLQKQFDEKYGQGRAAEILKDNPLAKGAR